MELLSEKQVLSYLGYSQNSNILAQMRMKTNKGRWEFTPRFVKFNGHIRYPKEWLESDIKEFLEAKDSDLKGEFSP